MTTAAASVGPDRVEAESFLCALTDEDDPIVTFQTFNDTKSGPNLARVYHGTLGEHWDQLVRLNRQGAGIYLMVNRGDGRVHDGEDTCRTAVSVTTLRALFIDDDDGKIDPAALPVPPSIVVQSKHGVHVYWKLWPWEPRDRFTDAQKALAARFDTDDSICDLPRVMRVPGFFHLKDPHDPFMVTIPLSCPSRVFSFSGVIDGTGATMTPPPVNGAATATVVAGWRVIPDGGADPVARARAWLAKRPGAVQGDHGDDHTFRTAAQLVVDYALSDGDALALMLESWNGTCVPPWSEDELRAKIASAKKSGTHPVGAKLDGNATPGGTPGTPKPATLKPAGLDLDSHWVRWTAADLARDPPEKEWIWQGMIGVGDVGTLAATGGTGKTSLEVGLAIHRALGRPFLGRPVRQGTTVIVTTEDGREDYERKIAAWRDWMDLTPADLAAVAKHVHLIDLQGEPFRLVSGRYGEYVPTECAEMLAACVKRHAPDADLTVIETVSRVGGDEGNAAMSALIVAGEQYRKATKSAVSFVSHVSQDAARRGTLDAFAPRGGSALGDNGRYTIVLAQLTKETRGGLIPGVTITDEQMDSVLVMTAPKINGAAKPAPLVLERVPSLPWGVVIHPFAGAAVPRTAADVRRAMGVALEALARRYNGTLTESKLGKDKTWEQIPGLAKGRIAAVVGEAIADGFIHRGPAGRGGGNGCLLPGRDPNSLDSQVGRDPG
jgi:hypothetical protein